MLNERQIRRVQILTKPIHIDGESDRNRETETERAQRLLDSIDIELIEQYLRNKKLERIRNNIK